MERHKKRVLRTYSRRSQTRSFRRIPVEAGAKDTAGTRDGVKGGEGANEDAVDGTITKATGTMIATTTDSMIDAATTDTTNDATAKTAPNKETRPKRGAKRRREEGYEDAIYDSTATTSSGETSGADRKEQQAETTKVAGARENGRVYNTRSSERISPRASDEKGTSGDSPKRTPNKTKTTKGDKKTLFSYFTKLPPPPPPPPKMAPPQTPKRPRRLLIPESGHSGLDTPVFPTPASDSIPLPSLPSLPSSPSRSNPPSSPLRLIGPRKRLRLRLYPQSSPPPPSSSPSVISKRRSHTVPDTGTPMPSTPNSAVSSWSRVTDDLGMGRTRRSSKIQTTISLSGMAYEECRVCNTVWSRHNRQDVRLHERRHKAAVKRLEERWGKIVGDDDKMERERKKGEDEGGKEEKDDGEEKDKEKENEGGKDEKENEGEDKDTDQGNGGVGVSDLGGQGALTDVGSDE